MASSSVPFWAWSCYVTRVHQRACGTFSPPVHKKVKNGFQSKCPPKMVFCTGCLGHSHCTWNPEEWCLSNWAASSRADVTEPLLQCAELFWCDMGLCLCEGLNVSLYGAMTLWFPRLEFQTSVCAHVCVHPWERDTHTCAHARTHIGHRRSCIHTGPLYSLQSKLVLNDSLETK